MLSLIPSRWRDALATEVAKPYFAKLQRHVNDAYAEQTVYPPRELIFRALSFVPPEDVRVVILGQDPYHGPGEANGLAFAVHNYVSPKPPSLVNIYKEIERDLRCELNRYTTSLEGWARQGVLLLNTSLTVAHKEPGSHAGLGWQPFTDAIISLINASGNPTAFLLWGNHAKAKRSLVNSRKHLVLDTSHPSPFSVHSGFSGCGHFSQANCFLLDNGRDPIDWSEVEDYLMDDIPF